jgi:putative hydrolase of the HAD superfamily
LAQNVEAVIFDWGDTLMRDLPEYQGAMVHWPVVALVPGAMAALQTLTGQTGLVLAVASNAGDSDAELMGLALERAGIQSDGALTGRHFFDHLWTSRELGASKPERAFFQAILDRLGLEAAECLMVGNDYQMDIVPAKAIGMQTVWLAHPPMDGAPRLPSHRHEDRHSPWLRSPRLRSGQAGHRDGSGTPQVGQAPAADAVIQSVDDLPAAIDALGRDDRRPKDRAKDSSPQR